MIENRHAPTGTPNPELEDWTGDFKGQSNLAFLRRAGEKAADGGGPGGAIVLIGGSTVAHFRIRVAQSHLRGDMTPSLWSQAAILRDGETVDTVPLDLRGEASEVPRNNGVMTCRFEDFDDPVRYPNVAVINFTESFAGRAKSVEMVKAQRSVADLPTLMLPWLGFVWGAGEGQNPLIKGQGLPSAVFAETVFGIAGIDLTPGLSTSASCPEAIWQAAKWWWEQFSPEALGLVNPELAAPCKPRGFYLIRQCEAAVTGQMKEDAATAEAAGTASTGASPAEISPAI